MAYITCIKRERRDAILSAQHADGVDIQDIPWETLGKDRAEYRASRLRMYRRHPKLLEDSKRVLETIPKPETDRHFYSFNW